MKMSGEQVIPAPRLRVWEALNDPEVLKQSIPGCQELDKTSPTTFTAKVTAKVGPVKANFSGEVSLSDINAPESYVISGQGKGGAAGFAKGGAHVRLEELDEGTRLVYDVDAQVGGKLAQIGSRLIDSTARKMADDFFRRFNEVVTGREPGAGAAAAEPVEQSQAPSKKKPAKKAAATGAAPTRRTGTGSTARSAGPGAATSREPEAAEHELQTPPSLMPEAVVAASAASDETRRAETGPQPFWAGNGIWWMVGVAILALILIILATS